MANNENEKSETKDTSHIEKTATDGKAPNVGAGPVGSDLIADGGHGEAKQPKEHTGKNTEMGGATGGTPGLGDASEGNDNTGTAGQQLKMMVVSLKSFPMYCKELWKVTYKRALHKDNALKTQNRRQVIFL